VCVCGRGGGVRARLFVCDYVCAVCVCGVCVYVVHE
jgi:hypothetical protein